MQVQDLVEALKKELAYCKREAARIPPKRLPTWFEGDSSRAFVGRAIDAMADQLFFEGRIAGLQRGLDVIEPLVKQLKAEQVKLEEI